MSIQKKVTYTLLKKELIMSSLFKSPEVKVPSSKVLIITYDFYPDASPNTYRWLNIAKRWKDQGVEVYVISANKSQFSSYEDVDGIKIYRTGEFAVGNLKYNFNKQNRNAVGKSSARFSIKGFVKMLIRKLYDMTWSNLYWPDYSFLWKFTALPIAVKLIKEQKIDKVITVSWMFTAHLIGYKLKTQFDKLFWLADTVDPFSFNSKINNRFLYGKLNVLTEKKVFYKADLNSVLTERIKEAYIARFPQAKEKIMVNNNVFLPIDFDYSKTSVPGTPIKLVFLGTLSEDTRSPKNLLILFERLINSFKDSKFELSFFGDFTTSLQVFSQYDHMINHSIFLNSRISRDEVNLVIKNADVLINIGNSNQYQEPSKVIEYMYSGKKILNVCTIVEDTSANLLEKYPLHLNVFPSDLYSDSTVTNVYNFLVSKDSVSKDFLSQILNNYLLNTVADKYYNSVFKS